MFKGFALSLYKLYQFYVQLANLIYCVQKRSRLKLWTDGRTTEPAYTISSPGAFGSGELKTKLGVMQFMLIEKIGVGSVCVGGGKGVPKF